jgi:adenosylmethionine-8-amino-7-oxononanoate aminotransferase
MSTDRWDACTHAFWHGSAPMRYILGTTGPGDVWSRGFGPWLVDVSGRWFLDGRSGVGNMMLGYGRHDIADAMHRQAIDLPFVCTMRYERPAAVTVEYAQALVTVAPPSLRRVRFTHTGSSAVEAALLMARSYHRQLGHRDRKVLVSFRGSFHGSTLMAMAVSGQPILHRYFGPMPEGFAFIPPPDPTACPACSGRLDAESCAASFALAIERIGPERIAAVILEPVRGLSGTVLPHHYLRAVRRLCSEQDILLIFDEVFSGFGRMGPMFAAELSGTEPDIMCLSKGMTAGYAPLGGVLVADRVYQAFDGPQAYFAHGSSTDAHPVACAAGLATLRAFAAEGVLDQGQAMGARLRSAVAERLAACPLVSGVRAVGAYVAVDLVGPDGRPAPMAMKRHIEADCRRRGVLVDYTPETLMLVPPLTLGAEDGGLLAETLAAALWEFREGDLDSVAPRPPTLRGHR